MKRSTETTLLLLALCFIAAYLAGVLSDLIY